MSHRAMGTRRVKIQVYSSRVQSDWRFWDEFWIGRVQKCGPLGLEKAGKTMTIFSKVDYKLGLKIPTSNYHFVGFLKVIFIFMLKIEFRFDSEVYNCLTVSQTFFFMIFPLNGKSNE